jgi:2-dehydropantoate 2-reductase
MRATLKAVMQEAVALANAEGAKLPVDFVNERMALVDTLPEGMKASMLHDLQAGRPLELPWLSGAVVRLGQRHALEARVNRAIVSALKPRAGGSPPR